MSPMTLGMGLGLTHLGGGGGVVAPASANALAAFDPYLPSSMGLVAARKFDASGKYFSVQVDSTHNKPLCLSEDATYSKFFISWWMRIDASAWITDWASHLPSDGEKLFGVYNSALSRFSWGVRLRTPAGGATSLDVIASTDALGTAVVVNNKFLRAGDSLTNVFGTSDSSTPQTDTWHHCAIYYDGSQTGDANICHFWLNGVKQVSPAGSNLPAKFGIPVAGNSVNFYINQPSSTARWSILNLVVCNGVPPGTEAAAVASAYNNGIRPLTLTEWTAASATLSTPLWFSNFKDNQNLTTGAAPSGNISNEVTPATYDLTDTGTVTGELQVQSWTDTINSYIAYFGYTPTRTTGRAQYWGIYKPTGRAGKPCVYVRPQVSNTLITGAYAASATITNLQSAMGSSGSMISNGVVGHKGSVTSDVNMLTVFDDATGVGGTGCDRVLACTFVGYNLYSNPAPVADGTVTFVPVADGQDLIVTKIAHGLSDGDYVWFTSPSGVGPDWLPAPLNAYPYYTDNVTTSGYQVKVVSSSQFKVCLPNATTTPGTPIVAVGDAGSSGAGVPPIVASYTRVSATSCNFRPTMFSKSGTGNPVDYSGPTGRPIGREYNQFGIELPGIPTVGATYPPIGTEFTFEINNDGSGLTATNYAANPLGPHHIIINGSNQPTMYHDDGAAGFKGSMWGDDFVSLNRIGLGGYGNVSTAGVASEPGNHSEIYFGRQVITKSGLTRSVLNGIHRWAMT